MCWVCERMGGPEDAVMFCTPDSAVGCLSSLSFPEMACGSHHASVWAKTPSILRLTLLSQFVLSWGTALLKSLYNQEFWAINLWTLWQAQAESDLQMSPLKEVAFERNLQIVVSLFTCQNQISVLIMCLKQTQISVINILCQAHLTGLK